MNRCEIKNRLINNDIPFGIELPDQLMIYFHLLKEWNRKIDLTSVTDEEETLDKHFIDSLTVLKTDIIIYNSYLIDVGTGAGFPGMVLAMARPDLHVTLLDSQQKRLTFLNSVKEAAGLRNVVILHSRAEEAARKKELRECFDYATARALAPLNVLCEYLLPFVRTGGFALCWKGPALNQELEAGRIAAQLLGGRIELPLISPVYGRDWDHRILPISKVQHTDIIYPRKAGTPKSRPLGT